MSGSLIDRVRAAARRWRVVGALACNVVLAEIGARIGLPGVDGQRVRDFLAAAPSGLLRLYDLLVGGGISRAAVLALGAVPYLQAKLYLWLARAALPSVRRATSSPDTRRSIVRVGTVALALVQSFGFASFLQGIPGAVANPGVGFLSRTVLLITGGSVVVGWLAESFIRIAHPRAAVDDDMEQRYEDSVPSEQETSTAAGLRG